MTSQSTLPIVVGYSSARSRRLRIAAVIAIEMAARNQHFGEGTTDSDGDVAEQLVEIGVNVGSDRGQVGVCRKRDPHGG